MSDCKYCGAPMVQNPRTDKWFCQDKCWLNQPQQQRQQPPRQQPKQPYKQTRSPHETRSIIIQAMIKAVGYNFDWEKKREQPNAKEFAERVQSVLGLHDFLVAKPSSPPVNFGGTPHPGPTDELQYRNQPEPPPPDEPPDWVNN
jgi:hypothetical protein